MKEQSNRIVLQDMTADGSLKQFLDIHLCLSLNPSSKEWEEAVIKQTPILGQYLLKGAKVPPPTQNLIRLFIPSPRTSTPMSLRSWDMVLSNLSIPIAIVCSTGASRAFLDLLKAWVEERKGREIRIKQGEIEIVIKGGVTKKDMERAVSMFEKQFGHSKLIKP